MKKIKLLEILQSKYNGKYKLISNNDIFHKKDIVILFCEKHREFTKKLNDFAYGVKLSFCPKCSYEKLSKKYSKTNEEFLNEINNIFGNKITILEMYKNAKTKIKVRNNVTNEIIYVLPNNLLINNYKTDNESRSNKQKNLFIKKMNKIFENKFTIKKFIYNRNKPNRVILFCKKHGEFEKRSSSVLEGYGCPKCSYDRIRKTKKEFIEEVKEIHLDKYNYSKVEYKNNRTKVCIICPVHGEFLQSPKQHTRGEGCPYCNESKGERKISYFLKKRNIIFKRQKKFMKCINLKTNRQLPFDFYLSEYNILIEYDGEQHFIENNCGYFTEEKILKIKERDLLKNKFCIENKFMLYRIPYTKFNIIQDILKYILDPKTGKKDCFVFDFCDKGNLFTERHSEMREKIYKKAGFEVGYSSVKITSNETKRNT